MSCKYKNKDNSHICNLTNGYCQFQTMDAGCPICRSQQLFELRQKELHQEQKDKVRAKQWLEELKKKKAQK